jgi:pilus assembly protein CpaC
MVRLAVIAIILAATVAGVRAMDIGHSLAGGGSTELARIAIPDTARAPLQIASMVLPPRESYPEVGPAQAETARPTIRPTPRIAEAMIAADAESEPRQIAPQDDTPAQAEDAGDAGTETPQADDSRDIVVPRLSAEKQTSEPATPGADAKQPASAVPAPAAKTLPSRVAQTGSSGGVSSRVRLSSGPSVQEEVAANLRPPGNDPGRSTVIRTGDDVIKVEVGKGALVRLPSQAATVFIANPDFADVQVKTSTLIYVFGKAAGETVLYAVDEDENVVLGSALQVTHNISGLQRALAEFYPRNRIDVSASGRSLMLSGVVDSPEEVANVRTIAGRFVPNPQAVINNLKVVAPNQINLRVRVAEVSRGDLKRLGINWDAIGKAGNFVFGLATGNTAAIVGDVFQTRQGSPSGRSFFGGYSGHNLDVNGVIDALQDEGVISVLAEPNLTALSGETASFLAGGEFPIPYEGNNNNGGIRIVFKKYGVSLEFTPTILTPGRINLKVRPEVSQLDFSAQTVVTTEQGLVIPSLLTRRAETTVELGSGQSFAIAGLLQNNVNQSVQKVPLLGDIPILGRLFRSERFQKDESELVIIVTPYIVRPSSGELATPVDGFEAASDSERFATGAAYRQKVKESGVDPATPQAPRLVGPAGFILE